VTRGQFPELDLLRDMGKTKVSAISSRGLRRHLEVEGTGEGNRVVGDPAGTTIQRVLILAVVVKCCGQFVECGESGGVVDSGCLLSEMA
jgi:hypothetical protein